MPPDISGLQPCVQDGHPRYRRFQPTAVVIIFLYWLSMIDLPSTWPQVVETALHAAVATLTAQIMGDAARRFAFQAWRITTSVCATVMRSMRLTARWVAARVEVRIRFGLQTRRGRSRPNLGTC